MSLVSKIVFGSACIFSIGVIGYVHYKQYMDRKLLHTGVLNDIERRQKRKSENIYTLQQQIELAKELKKQGGKDGLR